MHRRRPRVALCVLNLLSAAVLIPGLLGARARAARVTCCPAPRIDLSPAIYAVRQGRGQRTTTLTRGDEARFVLLFRAFNSPYVPGAAARWVSSSAILYITRASPAGVRQGSVIYTVPLARHALPHGDTRFSRTLRLQTPVAGQLLASFIVTNTQGGSAGASIPFTVTPERPSQPAPRRAPTPPGPPGGPPGAPHGPQGHMKSTPPPSARPPSRQRYRASINRTPSCKPSEFLSQTAQLLSQNRTVVEPSVSLCASCPFSLTIEPLFLRCMTPCPCPMAH